MPRPPSFDRDELIERACRLFWRQGWAGTSMKDLEAELGLKPGSFYAAFGSKDALFALALERYAADGAARLGALETRLGPVETLKAHLAQVVSREDGAPLPCMLAKTVLELGPKGHALADKAQTCLGAMEARFAALFRQGQAVGQIAPHHDPERLARRFQSDLLGLRVTAQRPDVDADALAADIGRDLDRLG
ncbi:TetR/AcrR family transcriptional regulator [Roseovarius aquimarinus]|uniref:TetR/AcrR family transcriptional regulator n=1 Tax=Roseovarius aquimarinus TaxID=1229156 RepID=A0ABW7I7C1_9RHOB